MTEPELAKRKCRACVPGAPSLDEAAAAALHAQIDPGWERDGTGTLRRAFKFPNFRDACGFATRLAPRTLPNCSPAVAGRVWWFLGGVVGRGRVAGGDTAAT